MSSSSQGQCIPKLSERISVTETPVIAFTRRVMAMRPDTVSLAQGIVYWPPPPEALAAAAAALSDPATAATVSSYGPNEGLPELREALRAKVATQNGLSGHNICVTHGANQAFVNLVLTLVDAKDRVVLFKPAYFDHLMTITQTGGADNIVWGECDPHTLHPDITWLRGAMSGPSPPKLVVICNPCNPTGVLLSKGELEEISNICAQAGAWLVVDETYEDFVWGWAGASDPGSSSSSSTAPQEPPAHHCVCAPHVVHLFSFSKAYGMMGWRVGYVAYWDPDGRDVTGIGGGLLKCQDTVCICAGQLSQHVALAALKHGGEYKGRMVESLRGNRQLLLDALSPLGSLGDGSIAGGEGGLYFWARLPPGCEDDGKTVEWLVRHAGVCLVPGSSCAAPGYVRCSFGNLPPERMPAAAARLREGLARLVAARGLPE